MRRKPVGHGAGEVRRRRFRPSPKWRRPLSVPCQSEPCLPKCDSPAGPGMAAMDFPQHSKQVLEQLNQQRQLGLLCDCTFVVDGIDFKAHKAVLAACSEYFRMLFVDQKDVVHLDISNAAGLGQVLEFMYTAKLSLSPENVEDVLAVAGFLQMQEIVNACNALKSLTVSAEPNSESHKVPEVTGDEKAPEEGKAAAETLGGLDKAEEMTEAAAEPKEKEPEEEDSKETSDRAGAGDAVREDSHSEVPSSQQPEDTRPNNASPAAKCRSSQSSEQASLCLLNLQKWRWSWRGRRKRRRRQRRKRRKPKSQRKRSHGWKTETTLRITSQGAQTPGWRTPGKPGCCDQAPTATGPSRKPTAR
uniref:BTB domain-containing protein n=1 Tax=Terrapene triunguis TaxID=2587831 RepID=A0A674K9W1_9SAUR